LAACPPHQRPGTHRGGETPDHAQPGHRDAGEGSQPLGERAGPHSLAVHRGVDAADRGASRLDAAQLRPLEDRQADLGNAQPEQRPRDPGPDGLQRLPRPLVHVFSGGGVISTSTRASAAPAFRRPCELPAGHNTASPSRSSCRSPSSSTVGRPSRTTYTLSDLACAWAVWAWPGRRQYTSRKNLSVVKRLCFWSFASAKPRMSGRCWTFTSPLYSCDSHGSAPPA